MRSVAAMHGVLFLESEEAAELYVADVVDGSGNLIRAREGLTRLDVSVIVDTVGSVSALEARRGMLGFGREPRKTVVITSPPPQGGSKDG